MDLEMHPCPVLDIFLVWFAFLWDTVCLGCASRLALEPAVGFFPCPVSIQPLGVCAGSACGGCSLCPSGTEQELIHRPLNDPCSPVGWLLHSVFSKKWFLAPMGAGTGEAPGHHGGGVCV